MSREIDKMFLHDTKGNICQKSEQKKEFLTTC